MPVFPIQLYLFSQSKIRNHDLFFFVLYILHFRHTSGVDFKELNRKAAAEKREREEEERRKQEKVDSSTLFEAIQLVCLLSIFIGNRRTTNSIRKSERII